MRDGFRVWRRAWRHLNHRGYLYIWGNVLWALLSLPLITAPLAWAALCFLSYQSYRSYSVTLDDFWLTFRTYWRQGLSFGLINLLILLVNGSNLLVYGTASEWIRLVWALTLALWLLVQLFMWPFFFHMARPTWWGALRNAGVLLLLNPLFALTVGLGALLVVAFSMAFPVAWVLLTGSALATLANAAVESRLEAAGHPDSSLINEEFV